MNTELDLINAGYLRIMTDHFTDKTQIAAAEKELPELLTRATAKASLGESSVGLSSNALDAVGKHGLQWLISEMEKRGFKTHHDRPPYCRRVMTWWSW